MNVNRRSLRLCYGMTDFSTLTALAYKGERAAGRKLARDTGIGEEAALRATLERIAGAPGLERLLDERSATRAAALTRTTARLEKKAIALELRKARHDGPPTAWRAWFDGSAHPNPGRCGIGGLLTGPGGEHIEISRPAGYGNSSEAEYLALIAVLESAASVGARELTVYGDSQVVIGDVTAPDTASAASLAELRAAARALMAQLGGVALRWIPRHKNGDADRLSQRAARRDEDA